MTMIGEILIIITPLDLDLTKEQRRRKTSTTIMSITMIQIWAQIYRSHHTSIHNLVKGMR